MQMPYTRTGVSQTAKGEAPGSRGSRGGGGEAAETAAALPRSWAVTRSLFFLTSRQLLQ